MQGRAQVRGPDVRRGTHALLTAPPPRRLRGYEVRPRAVEGLTRTPANANETL